MKKVSEYFYKLGGSIWLLTAGLSALALLATLLSDWSLSVESWRNLWLIGGTGGLACLIVGGVSGIWSR